MITYVNTVLVANNAGADILTREQIEGVVSAEAAKALAGTFAFMNLDTFIEGGDPYTPALCKKFKIGVATGEYTAKVLNISGTKTLVYIPTIKWSNDIVTHDIKQVSMLEYPEDGVERKEETVFIDFDDSNFPTALATRGGFPIVVRITYKDMPTRYRQWSESYDYYVKPGDSKADIATNLANIINNQPRRARVLASVDGTKLVLEALPYTDNETADSENFNAKVRFNATAWYSDPLLPGFASSNRNAIGKITKVNGWEYAASAKNVRDRERTAQGYQGILNRTEWYDAKPAMAVNMNGQYSAITIEFENMYRAADDIFRKTKQTVEIYGTSSTGEAVETADFGGDLGGFIQSILGYGIRVEYANNSSSYADEPDASN